MKSKVLFALTLLLTACGSDTATQNALQGPAGPQGPAGKDGVTIVSNQLIQPVNTDLCTEFASEICRFPGGQLVTFSDGTVFLTAAFQFLYLSPGEDMDTDSDQTALSAVVPGDVDSVWLLASELVARGDGYKRLFLVYQRSPKELALVYDEDESGDPTVGDSVLGTLTLKNW